MKKLKAIHPEEKVLEELININPFKNELEFKNGTYIEWELNPSIPDIEESNFNIKLGHNFKKSDVKIQIEIDGEIKTFTSGINNSDFNCKFEATKRF